MAAAFDWSKLSPRIGESSPNRKVVKSQSIEKPHQFYKAGEGKDFTMIKTATNVMRFEQFNKRSYHGSIYMKEHSPDYYDSDKIE